MRTNHKDVKLELKKLNKKVTKLADIEERRAKFFLEKLQSLDRQVDYELGDKNSILWFFGIVLAVNFVLTCVILLGAV